MVCLKSFHFKNDAVVVQVALKVALENARYGGFQKCLNVGRSVYMLKNTTLKETMLKDIFMPPNLKYGSFLEVIYGTQCTELGEKLFETVNEASYCFPVGQFKDM